MRRPVALAALVLLAGCGSSGSTTTAGPADARTVTIEMHDIAFVPGAVDVHPGEKVRFVFKNTGQVTHDAFIGDAAAQDSHEMEMRDGHAMHMGGADGVSVKPGKTATITYTVPPSGQILIGCHQPGHYSGGMKAAINIA